MPDYKKLVDTLVKCPDCKGHGSIPEYGPEHFGGVQFMKGRVKCKICRGYGMVDWIAGITNVKPPVDILMIKLSNVSWTCLYFDAWQHRLNPKRELIDTFDSLEFLVDKQIKLFWEQGRLEVREWKNI